jgi:hypothetical protein
MGAVVNRELLMESVQRALIVIDGDGVELMNDVFAFFTIGGNPDDATWLCVGGGHTLLPSCIAGREQNVGSLSRRRLELDVADEDTIAHERLGSDALSVFGVLYRISVYGSALASITVRDFAIRSEECQHAKY